MRLVWFRRFILMAATRMWRQTVKQQRSSSSKLRTVQSVQRGEKIKPYFVQDDRNVHLGLDLQLRFTLLPTAKSSSSCFQHAATTDLNHFISSFIVSIRVEHINTWLLVETYTRTTSEDALKETAKYCFHLPQTDYKRDRWLYWDVINHLSKLTSEGSFPEQKFKSPCALQDSDNAAPWRTTSPAVKHAWIKESIPDCIWSWNKRCHQRLQQNVTKLQISDWIFHFCRNKL